MKKLSVPILPEPTQVETPLLSEIRQHNALINSPFALTTLEWRALTAVMRRIRPEDEELKEHFIPAAELVDVSKGGGKAYKQIAILSNQLTGRKLSIEQLGPNGERVKRPDYRIIPLLALASYVEKRGGLVLVLNPLFKPYLLQLAEKGNFTKTRVAELKHLKAGHAFKLYLLLSEYRTFGSRTFTLPDLRFRLGIGEEEYKGRFDNFKAKVLDPAKLSLAKTNLAFELEVIRKGHSVQLLRFVFQAQPLLLAESSEGEVIELSAEPEPLEAALLELPAEEWAQQLRAQGVSEEGCALIRRHLAEGQYPAAYLDYVQQVLRKPRKSPVRKPADYLFKCITGKLLLEEFQRSLVPAPAPAAPVGASRARASRAATPVATETVFELADVRQMYEQPGPFAKRQGQAVTFEEHLQRIYLSQGFVQEIRGGKEVLVLRPH